MAFAFSIKDKTVERTLRRIARQRLSASLDLLQADRMARDELVHELRKNTKKLRALLRLVRSEFTGFERENNALRDAAQIISEQRDADVLGRLFNALAAESGLDAGRITALRARHFATIRPATDLTDALMAHGRAIADINRRAGKWRVAAAGFAALDGGLERSWSAARRAMRLALAAPGGEALHRGRKRIKDHWYQARLLAPIWPEMMAPHIATADLLGETLGDARDLARLAEALAGDRDAALIAHLATGRATELLRRAGPVAARFLSEPPEGLARRWRGWWEVWQG
ncbi:CHAD domain-containing protein [Albidovulum sp.]|uniref:CHAD domain-containing protein n=1 Tax=Albidovulum sp. TaxID=1872424 RepID=UPI003528B868